MATKEKVKQVNLKLAPALYDAADDFAQTYGYRNIQELTTDSLREKIFEKSMYDETFTEKEIELIDKIITKSILSDKLVDAKTIFKGLK
jgi:hypothetical protein